MSLANIYVQIDGLGKNTLTTLVEEVISLKRCLARRQSIRQIRGPLLLSSMA